MSEDQKKAVEKIPQHAHCSVCGKAITSDKSICSDDCQKNFDLMVKRKKMYIYVLYGMIAVFVLLMFMSY